jgi:citrate synthase
MNLERVNEIISEYINTEIGKPLHEAYDIDPTLSIINCDELVYLYLEYNLPTFATRDEANNCFENDREETIYMCITEEDVINAMEIITGELNDAEYKYNNHESN